MRAKRASLKNIKISLLKEIGILKHFIARKSLKIAKIETMFCKRHLAIFRIFRNFLVKLLLTLVQQFLLQPCSISELEGIRHQSKANFLDSLIDARYQEPSTEQPLLHCKVGDRMY